MSIEISQRVWKHSKQYGSNKLVLLVLADHANSDGYCFPGVDRIAQWSAVEERQARRIIHEIEEHGELYIHIGGGRSGTNQYLVTVAMDRVDMVNALVRYFDVDRTRAEEIAGTICALRESENPKPSRRTKNPVLQDEGGVEDTVKVDNLSCETPPPVLQDTNPVVQRGNPVVQTPRTVINHQLTTKEPEGLPLSSQNLKTRLRALFHIPLDDSWEWLDLLCAEIPDETFLMDHAEYARSLQSHVMFNRAAFIRTARITYQRTHRKSEEPA